MMFGSLFLAAQALAGSCCVGSTSPVPTRLGECERVLVGVGVSGEASLGRWDRSGRLAPGSLVERGGVATFASAWRWDRKGQVSVSLPVRLQHRATDAASEWGVGVGDASATVLFDPWEERGGPAPLLSLGARLPTGRGWKASTSPLHADVTGLEEPAVTAGVALERLMGDNPWSVGVDTAVGVGDGLQPTVTAYGSLGRYLGVGWTVLGTLRHTEAWTPEGGANGRTAAGVRAVYGVPVRWRAWAGLDADLPVPGLGHSATRLATVQLGFTRIR